LKGWRQVLLVIAVDVGHRGEIYLWHRRDRSVLPAPGQSWAADRGDGRSGQGAARGLWRISLEAV